MDAGKCLWTVFSKKFKDILNEDDYYSSLLKFLSSYDNNILLYGSHGFPIELFIDEVIKAKFNISDIYKKETLWNKDFIYFYSQYFIEIDMMNPSILKNSSAVPNFITSIIKSRHVNNSKHLFVIKNIENMSSNDFSNFRIIFEKYSKNVYFICTTHKITKIDTPVQSRFNLFRMPTFKHDNIVSIFDRHLGHSLNNHLIEIRTRNIISCIFISQVEIEEPSLVSKEFCTLHYPPICDFVKDFDKKKFDVEAIRHFSYKCFQYKIEIPEILKDLLQILPARKKLKAIAYASSIDHSLHTTNKAREPLYIECFLCQVLM